MCVAWLALWVTAARAEQTFLDPEAAFVFSTSEAPGEVDVHFRVANQYHMYRERFAFAVRNGQATLGTPQMPAGQVTYDEAFGKNTEIYHGGDLLIRVPVQQAAGPFDLAVTSQGCADAGICYPPAEHVVHVDGAALKGGAAALAATTGGISDDSQPWYVRVTSAEYASSLLQGRGLIAVVALFFVAGMVLSLLPCSYPMIPILSAIIVGSGERVTRVRALSLSLSYVLGMALVYTALGIAAASAGEALGAWLQNPWVLGAFAVLLAGFAFSLIAGKDLQMPRFLQDRAERASASRTGGNLLAVAVMGALSALVVGACMTAPLFAVLTFVAHTGNVWLGGAALFSMGLGLGVPLLIVGLGAGTLLPRAGAWMNGVKTFFGVILLLAALWIVWPVSGNVLRMGACAVWLLLVAFLLFDRFKAGAMQPPKTIWGVPRRARWAAGALCVVWAGALLVGMTFGNSNPFRPLQAITGRGLAHDVAAGPAFAPVSTTAELDQVLQQASGPVLLDFYADWCVSCKEMEHDTFVNPQVVAKLGQMQLLRADVTPNNSEDQALLKRFGLFGPPGIIVFQNGHEVGRVVGYQNAGTFLRSLTAAGV
jgi:thioredoxin:protein disulfide reductase